MQSWIGPPATPDDLAAARALVEEYAGSLSFSLDFQGFRQEMASFPGVYAPPRGALLLARHAGRPAGVVALRDLGAGIAEMKRLHVTDAARGHGLGRRLAEAIIAEAVRLGYRAMRLDTVPGSHDRAIALYRSLGFREIGPYYDSQLADALYFELPLGDADR